MFNIKWRVVVARTLIIVLAGNPLIMAAHGIENAQLAAGQQAAMKRSANGTEVIDIVAPSKKGVSHNKFTQFNVTPDGLILNNSQGPAMSVIGGWTDGNRRLAGGTASLILAEVTSNKRSSLRGYTEVLGDSAEFVLANPNGISCNGCGFINTPRVMLATGVPDLMNGDLMGIDVTGGDVSIDGAGLNASNVDKFDILTRAMRLNAALYANELNIRTGSNYYDFNTLQARKSSNQPDSADYQFALDASNLGAMYANTISLIGTEAGLGVRSKGLITSTDSMQLTADGQLELKNTIAGGGLALRSQNADVITHGTTYGKDVSIKLADTLQNKGIIAAADSMDITAAELQQNGNLIAGLNQQGEWLAGASQQLNVSGTLVNRGRIISQGQQTLSAEELKNTSGSLLQANETTLNTQKLVNSGVLNSNALTIKAETAQNAGHIQAQELAIDAKQFKQTQGVVYQAGSNGNLSFTGNNLQLDGGVLVVDGDSQLNASDSIRNKGTLLTAGDASITTKKLQNTGRMTAGQLNIDASTVTNDSDALIEAKQANLSAKALHNAGTLLATGEQGDSLLLQTDELTNRGRIESHGENLTLNNVELDNRQGQIYQHGDGALQLNFLGDLRNDGGEIYSAGQLNIAGGDVDNTGGVLTALESLQLKGSDISNNDGVMASDGLLDINADNIDNTGGALQANAIQLNSQHNVNNSAGVINGQTVDLSATTLKNLNGVIQANGTENDSLKLSNIGQLNNDGGTIASHGRDLNLTLANLSNDNGKLLHLGEGSFTLSQDETLTNSGTIASAGNLILNAEQVNNEGSISADNNLELNATSLNNSQLLYGGNHAEVTAEAINNSGTLAATHLAVSDFNMLQNSGRIESDSASFTGATLNNLDSGVLINAGTQANALQLNVADLNNAGTVHNSSQNMSLGGNLDNSGNIIHAGSGELVLGNLGTIHNADGSIATGGTAKIQNSVTGAGTVYAAQGMELAANNGTLVNNSQLYTEGDMQVTSGLNNQGGSLLSDGNLTINTSDNVTNSGTLQGQNLDLTAGVLNNNAGVITSTGSNVAQIDTASLSNNDGVIQSANDSFSITTRSGELDNSNGQISHNGSSLTLNSASGLNQQSGVVQSTGQLIVNALGDLINNDGTIQASDDLTLNAAELNNQEGMLAANGGMQLVGDGINNSAGIIAAGSQLGITAGQLANDNGTLEADDIRIELSEALSNKKGTVFATNQLGIDAATLDNSLGTLASNGELKLDAAKVLTNREGLIQANTVNVSAEDIDNTSGTVQANALELSVENNLENAAGTINGQTVNLRAGTLKNTNGVILATAGDALQLNTIGLLSNNGGTIASAGNLLLNAEQVNNDGRISAENNLELNATKLHNSQLLYGRNNAAVKAETINNSGTLAATQLTASDFGLLQNSGRIESDSASYTGDTLDNLGGGVLINAGSGANSLELNVAGLNNAGTVHNSSQNMNLGGNLTNSGSIIHAGSGDLVLGSNGSIQNANGSIASAGTAKLQNSVIGAGSLYATQGMELASSGTFVNNSQLYTKGNIQVNSGLNNQGGSLLSDGNLTINTSDNVTNSGTLQGQNLDLTAGVLNNNAGVITSTGNESAQIDAASLSNSGGVIQSTNDNFTITTRTGGLDNSNGQISHNGSNLTLDSASHLNQQSGVVQSTGQLAVNAEGNLNNTGGILTGSQYQLTSSGTLNNNNGRIVGSGSGASSIESGALVNRSGYIAANGNNLTLNTAALDNNAGSILLAGTGNLDITSSSVASDAASSRIISNGAINLNGGTELKNAGQISSAKQLTLNAKTIGNSGTLASRAGKVDIDSVGTLTNSGTVSGATAVDLDVRTLNNRNGKVQSDGTVAINVNSLNVGQIQARNITLDSNNSIALQSSESISAGGNIDLNTNANINNSGTIVASGTLTADAKEMSNKSSGLIRSGGNATLDANKLTNNGTVSSNSVLRLDIANTSNTGTLAAATQLDINGNINNSNLLFASNLLTIDGNVSNTANIYSNRDASIAGSTVTNTGGSIAAARDLSISGKILNTYTGDFSYIAGSSITTTESTTGYINVAPSYKDINVWSSTNEIRTSQVYQAKLNGKAGIIAAGRNLGLDGDITNDFGTISAVGNLVLSGSSLTNNFAQSRKETEVTVVNGLWSGECMLTLLGPGNRELCTDIVDLTQTSETVQDTYTEVTYIEDESYGTIAAGNISGNLSGSIELNDVTPSDVNGSNVNTKASGSRGSASRGSSASNNSDTKVVVLRSKGSAQDTAGADRSDVDTDTVELDWRDNDVRPTSPKNVEVAVSPRDASAQNITDAERLAGAGNVTMPADNAELIRTSSPNKLGANTSGPGVQGVGFMAPDMADSLRMSQGSTPEAPGVQQGAGTVGNGNIANDSDYNPDLIIKGLVDDQKGTLAQQKESVQQQEGIQQQKNAQQQVAGQRAGQNVFMTDEQMRVLTEDLGFDADAINQGQEGLYSAISQNDLLEDGVTLSATGVIDITADAGLNIDSGIAAGEGLILRSEGGLNMGDYGHFDSDNLLGLQLGGDFTNDMSLESDTLWFDIGGDFTNQGELTGNNVLSINADDDLINQSLLSGGNVVLNAGGDIVNRTEFTQHTREYSDGGSRTYTLVGDSPEIISGESLSMNAGNNLDLQGSQLGAAGDISLHAGNDVLLNAVEKVNGHEKYFKGGYDIELDRTYDVVSLEAGGNLSVIAGNNLESEGAQFGAGGVASLAAGNDMNLMAVVESHYDADKKTKKSFLKKKVTETVSHHEEVQGTAITAENILLNATVDSSGQVVEQGGGDITLEGGELNASENIIGFGEDITLTAGTYQDYEYSHTSKSSFGGLKSSSREDLAQDDLLDGSTLSAGGNILLNAGNNLNILASQLEGDNIGLTAFNDVLIASGEESSIRESRSQSGGFFSGGSLFSSTEALTGSASITADSSVIDASGNIVIDAGSATVIGSSLDADEGIAVKTDIGDIQVLAAEERTETYSREEKIDIGFDAVLKALTRPDELIQSEDGQLKLSLGSATYDKVDFASESTSHKGSELNAGGSVSLDSVADVIIEGSEIDAGGNANLIAGGDVVVKEAEDSYSETKEEIHGSAEMSVVVQHQAVEVAKAAVAVDDAKDQVKQAKADYRKYQKEKDQLENTLAQLEADYANGVAGVNHADIVELRNLLDDVKGDEEWYVAGIATAAANLASKTTLLVQQTAAAAQSTASYGFNAGVQLDIAASKTDSSLDATSSLASTINGTNINVISGGDGLSGNTLIQGSALNAAQNLNILTGELDVLASQDTQRSETDTQSGSMTVAQTFWGAAGGPTVNASLNSSKQQDKQTTHNNSTLTANNLNIATTDDATIIGGNLHGANAVNMDIGGDLTLESVQDRFSGSNKGAGISGGMSLGGVFTNENGAKANSKEVKTTAIGKGGDVSSVNGGVNASSGRYRKTETVLSSITGGTVDVSVDGNTQLTGALLAAVDAEGNDTGNLSLNTGSLNTTDLTNRSYSSNQSFGVNASVGVSAAADPADPNVSELNSSNYSYQNESSQSLDKTLATIGEGSVSVNGEETTPDGVNRDVASVNEEIYDVDRQQGNIDLTVDHRLLSEDGRKQIAEDAKRTKIMGESIIDAVADSVSLTGSGEGEDSLRDHMGNKQDYFTATKTFTQNPANAEHVKTLSDGDATFEQKEAAYTALVNEIADYMGVDSTEAKVLMSNDPRFSEIAGAHSRDTDTVYVDDAAHDNASDAVNTVGHETQHYLDNQQNPDAEQTETYHDNREEYAGIMGDATEDYLGFNFAQNDTSLADGNSHNWGATTEERDRNKALVNENNASFRQEDEQALDYYLTKETVDKVKDCLAGATCTTAEQKAAVVADAEDLSVMLDNELNNVCRDNPTSDACRTSVNTATQYIGMEDAWDILEGDVSRSSKNTFDYVYNSDGAEENFDVYYNTIDNRTNFFGASDQYEQNIGLGGKWFGSAEFVSRAAWTGLGADENGSWASFGAGAALFPSTYNPLTSSELYEWRSEAGNTLMNAGFDNFKSLYNQEVSDPVAWDINQLQGEQQALQPVHEKYLGERTFFTGFSKFITNTDNFINVETLPWGSEQQGQPGGIDILDQQSRIKFGCKLMGYSESQGCKP